MRLNFKSYKIICDIIFSIITCSVMFIVVAAVTPLLLFFFFFNANSTQALKPHWKQRWRQMSCESDHSNTSVVRMALKAPKTLSGE